MNNRNKITALNFASTVILQGLAFFSGPVFSSLLSTDSYGIASVYLTWVQLAATVFSLQAASTFALARVNFPMEDQDSYQSSVMSLSTISFLLFSMLTIILLCVLEKSQELNMYMVILGLLHAWGLYIVTAMNAKFTHEFKAGRNLILSVTVSVLTIGGSILLIKLFPAKTNYWGRIIGQSAVYTLTGILLFVHMLSSGRIVYNKQYWQFTLKISIPTIFHLIANLILNQSDRVMLQRMNSNSAAGIYALACTFGAVLQTIWSALNNSWVPFYYEYTRHNQIDEMKKHAMNYIELFTILAMGFILLCKEVFHIYAKQNFWDGTDLVPLFAIGCYFVFLYSFPVNYEFYNKKTRTIALGTSFAAVCNIILNYFFINAWGIQGAVIATCVSHGLQFGFHFICAKRIIPGEFPFRFIQFVPGIMAVCITCVFYWALRDLWIIRWGIAAMLGAYLLVKIIIRREIF